MTTHSMETYEPTSISIHCLDRPCLKISVCVGKNVECDLLLVDSGEDYDEATELLQQAASGSQSYGGYGGYGYSLKPMTGSCRAPTWKWASPEKIRSELLILEAINLTQVPVRFSPTI